MQMRTFGLISVHLEAVFQYHNVSRFVFSEFDSFFDSARYSLLMKLIVVIKMVILTQPYYIYALESGAGGGGGSGT